MNSDFWIRLCLGALVIVGVHTLFLKEMLLEWLGELLARRLPYVLLKPLFECPPCMASIWGTMIWFGTGGQIDRFWPIYCLALCGLLKLISIEWLNRRNE